MRYPRRRGRAPTGHVHGTLFDVDVHPEFRYYRQILDALARADFGADQLSAELVVSRLCGTVWAGQEGRRDGATEEAFGSGLVDFARGHRAPTTMAVLRTLAVIAPIREVRVQASQAADSLAADGLPGPRWSPPVGAVTPGRCWTYEDVYGDQSVVICEYGYGPDLRRAPRHAIVVHVDHATFSVAARADVSRDVDMVIRDLRNEAKTCAPMFMLRQVESGWARALLERAIARLDLIGDIVPGPGLADLRALIMARTGTLPAALPSDPGRPTSTHRQVFIDEFLASAQLRALASHDAAVTVAELVLDYGAVRDPANPIRVSPTKWDIFLLDWLPKAAPGLLAEYEGLPDVLRAWSAWAGQRAALPAIAQDELRRSLDETLAGLGTATPPWM